MKKLNFNFLFLTFILLASNTFYACSNSEKKNNTLVHTYFRHVFIDDANSIIGKYPISDSVAKKFNCFHFVKDIEGKLLNVEYFKSGKLSDKNELGLAQIIIEYFDNKEKRYFINNANQGLKN